MQKSDASGLVANRISAGPADSFADKRADAGSTSMRIVSAGLLLLIVSERSVFGDVCTIGQPCGNACISVDDVCHMGSTISTPVAVGLGAATLGALGFLLWYVSPRGSSPGPLDVDVTLREARGAVRVEKGTSPKLRAGDVIDRVNNERVETMEDYQKALGRPNQGRCLHGNEVYMRVSEPEVREFCLSPDELEHVHLHFVLEDLDDASEPAPASRLDLQISGGGVFVGVSFRL